MCVCVCAHVVGRQDVCGEEGPSVSGQHPHQGHPVGTYSSGSSLLLFFILFICFILHAMSDDIFQAVAAGSSGPGARARCQSGHSARLWSRLQHQLHWLGVGSLRKTMDTERFSANHACEYEV